MKIWFTSLSGIVTLNALALLSWIGRLFIDFGNISDEGVGTLSQFIFVWLAVLAGWMWGLLGVQGGSRAGLIIILIYSLMTALAGLATVAVFCPTPCGPAVPLKDILFWSNLVTGLIAAIATGLHQRLIGQPPGG